MDRLLSGFWRRETGISDSEIKRPKQNTHLSVVVITHVKAAEALLKEQKQAGAIVLREATEGYVPLGVFNVRENVRNAMLTRGKEFESFKDAFSYVSGTMTLEPEYFIKSGRLLRSLMKEQQTRLSDFTSCKTEHSDGDNYDK